MKLPCASFEQFIKLPIHDQNGRLLEFSKKNKWARNAYQSLTKDYIKTEYWSQLENSFSELLPAGKRFIINLLKIIYFFESEVLNRKKNKSLNTA